MCQPRKSCHAEWPEPTRQYPGSSGRSPDPTPILQTSVPLAALLATTANKLSGSGCATKALAPFGPIFIQVINGSVSFHLQRTSRAQNASRPFQLEMVAGMAQGGNTTSINTIADNFISMRPKKGLQPKHNTTHLLSASLSASLDPRS